MAAEWGPTIQGSTRGMPGWSGHDLFCDAIAEVYVGVLPRRPERPSFDADFATYDLGDASLGMIDTPAVWADRTRSSIRHVPDDALFINHSTTPWGLQQGGREWATGAASALVLDNAQPFTVTVGENRRLRLSSLRVPQSLVGRRLAEPEALNDALSAPSSGPRWACSRLPRERAWQAPPPPWSTRFWSCSTRHPAASLRLTGWRP